MPQIILREICIKPLSYWVSGVIDTTDRMLSGVKDIADQDIL
jgi:hypothetical protein